MIALFSGCSWFKYYDRWEECDGLLERSKVQLEVAEYLIDSLVIDGMRKNDKIDSLKSKLLIRDCTGHGWEWDHLYFMHEDSIRAAMVRRKKGW